jgi:hypothetical protein
MIWRLVFCQIVTEQRRTFARAFASSINEDGSPSWELEACEFHESKDPVRESLEKGEISPTEYAKTVVEAFKAVCHPTCLSALSKAMPKNKAALILEESYAESVNVVALDPERYNLDVSFWYVLARKS